MQFVDEAIIFVQAGKGGAGALSFHRARNLPRGGPDGGNGGNGGNVYLVGDQALNTLVDFRFMPRCQADNGRPGGSRGKKGASGPDLAVRVPVGTAVADADTRGSLGDVDAPGARMLVARGGHRGLGNAHFKSSTNRAPRHTTPGTPGEQRRLRLELRVIADVGLLGMPNAGKSTLISRVSAAKPKVAPYPFTTLTPNLGTVRLGHDSFVMADVPGLVPGAATGAGLGLRFLKHLSRTRLLLHLVDSTPLMGDPLDNARRIEAELFAFSDAFRDRHLDGGHQGRSARCRGDVGELALRLQRAALLCRLRRHRRWRRTTSRRDHAARSGTAGAAPLRRGLRRGRTPAGRTHRRRHAAARLRAVATPAFPHHQLAGTAPWLNTHRHAQPSPMPRRG